MKTILKYIALVLFVLGTGKVASASTLVGSINFAGADVITTTGINQGIAFPAGQQQLTFPAATGDLASFTTASTVVFKNFSFLALSQLADPTTGVMLFTATDPSGDKLVFQVMSYTYNSTNNEYLFMGTITDTTSAGVVLGTNLATLDFRQSGPGTSTFSASLSTAPEPNSLILLGTGLVSAAGMMVRRRRQVA